MRIGMHWMDCFNFYRIFIRLIFGLLVIFVYNEYLIYYVTLLKCSWPKLNAAQEDPLIPKNEESPVRAMFLADTHLLGPYRGHPWDKLRREWQMERAFQTALTLFDPEIVFLLGDVFDEGQWVDADGWQEYLRRFHLIFRRANDVPLVVVPGNHDLGFHYHLTQNPFLVPRFDDVFNVNARPVSSLTVKGVSFVLLNSMAFEGDDCRLCKAASAQLLTLAKNLQCAKNNVSKGVEGWDCHGRQRLSAAPPVVLQHFPLFRSSDVNCNEPDEAPKEEKLTAFRPKWDCVSKRASIEILEKLKPRLIFSGHTHHGCLTHHKAPGLAKPVPEYSVSSFSWRNRNNPAFLLAQLRPDNHAVSKCLLPEEWTVIWTYLGCVSLLLLCLTLPCIRTCCLLARRRVAGLPWYNNKKL